MVHTALPLQVRPSWRNLCLPWNFFTWIWIYINVDIKVHPSSGHMTCTYGLIKLLEGLMMNMWSVIELQVYFINFLNGVFSSVRADVLCKIGAFIVTCRLLLCYLCWQWASTAYQRLPSWVPLPDCRWWDPNDGRKKAPSADSIEAIFILSMSYRPI